MEKPRYSVKHYAVRIPGFLAFEAVSCLLRELRSLLV